MRQLGTGHEMLIYPNDDSVPSSFISLRESWLSVSKDPCSIGSIGNQYLCYTI